jgi:hypothetical protein
MREMCDVNCDYECYFEKMHDIFSRIIYDMHGLYVLKYQERDKRKKG